MESRRFFFVFCVAQVYITPPPVVFTILGGFSGHDDKVGRDGAPSGCEDERLSVES